ncbi:MAG: hypothetical protein UX31_C0012G0021 [Candidatus Nomurabacteria bacterium GW2011_GWA1_46_11]|uniref:Uncharacterized protein n=1 Tax=Candidatus Nomurabacteria bacterium GW2011_GWA1_46_11 TaxID=1618732 RepID=A0A0G1RLH7_9BACT|nr:MAG: hypothetical protein UW69_C0094G0002 [Microgenomates group bacterium GW2011_GWA2_44_7]KKT77960.1 MAG: hypothetical protein UW73_C0009G0059 [Microgenomates group bacterium GW2011_GWB1_44_8]KKU21785.1 MAG: hypothetical protein UX31_C0012G0021 [Candidatus Nomurabacteria bacterium GW2011_GWA1_46_11]
MNNFGVIAFFDIWLIAKVFFVLAFAVYAGFAVMMVKQATLMKRTIRLGLDRLVIMTAWVHLIMVVLGLIGAVVIL